MIIKILGSGCSKCQALTENTRKALAEAGREAEIVKVALGADGTPMGAPVAFAKTGPAPDGIAVDTEGNVFVATQAGVEAYSPAGQKWGTVVLPGTQKATSIEFGGADNKTLYVASLANGLGGAGSPAIHKLELRVAGVN